MKNTEHSTVSSRSYLKFKYVLIKMTQLQNSQLQLLYPNLSILMLMDYRFYRKELTNRLAIHKAAEIVYE